MRQPGASLSSTFLQRLDAPFHAACALPQFDQRLLVVARQPTCIPPLGGWVM
jgi:hypothetical protein